MAHRDVVDGVVVAATVLYGAILYLAGELVCRCVMKKIDAVNRRVRYAKIAMASSMFIKTAFFIALLPSLNSVACAALSHIADFFYHMAMTAGAIVLLSRIRAVTPRKYDDRMITLHFLIVALRATIGVVDIALLSQMTDNGVCIYLEVYYWGPVYTLVDTAIDFYVTCMIGYRLLAHIRMLQRSRQTQGSVGSCVVVVIQNVIRTTILTLVNLMSAILIIFESAPQIILVLWPSINLLFIFLVGYDADIAKGIHTLSYQLQQPPHDVEAGGRPHIDETKSYPGNDYSIDLGHELNTTPAEGSRHATYRNDGVAGLVTTTPSFMSSSRDSYASSDMTDPVSQGQRQHSEETDGVHPVERTSSDEHVESSSPTVSECMSRPSDEADDYYSSTRLGLTSLDDEQSSRPRSSNFGVLSSIMENRRLNIPEIRFSSRSW